VGWGAFLFFERKKMAPKNWRCCFCQTKHVGNDIFHKIFQVWYANHIFVSTFHRKIWGFLSIEAKCADWSGCEDLGLFGDCCPESGGIMCPCGGSWWVMGFLDWTGRNDGF